MRKILKVSGLFVFFIGAFSILFSVIGLTQMQASRREYTETCSVTPSITISPISTPSSIPTEIVTPTPSTIITPTAGISATPTNMQTPSGSGISNGMHTAGDGKSDGLCSKPPCITPGNVPIAAPMTGRASQ